MRNLKEKKKALETIIKRNGITKKQTSQTKKKKHTELEESNDLKRKKRREC
jgi:hypothetical protein